MFPRSGYRFADKNMRHRAFAEQEALAAPA